MIKWILQRFRRDRGLHKATVRIDFFPDDQVTPHIYWQRGQNQEKDTVSLVVYSYARFLYELAELNEVRVARELMGFLEQVCKRVLTNEGPPRRPQLPLGQLRLIRDPGLPALRTYKVHFYELSGGDYRLEYHGSLGKEGFYLPGAFLALMQSCLDNLADETLRQLAQSLTRLHDYYRLRRDFWEGGSLSSGPAYALGEGELKAADERIEA